jgi:hypothetical protein
MFTDILYIVIMDPETEEDYSYQVLFYVGDFIARIFYRYDA